MSSIVFQPWIGPEFNNSDTRLLLLGESHYGAPDADPARSTCTVVENWRSGLWNIRYLAAAARLLSGKQNREYERATVLNRISFYNFVQVPMPDCGDRPSLRQLRDSIPAFKEVLDQLHPTHVLATGKLVWDNLPAFDGPAGQFACDGKLYEFGEYQTHCGFALAMQFPHLSRFFSPPLWTPVVQAFLSLKAANDASSQALTRNTLTIDAPP